MRAVAICCTVGRPQLSLLLGMWALQRVQLPLFIALDVDATRWLPDNPVGLAYSSDMPLGASRWAKPGPPGDTQWVAQRAPERVRREAYPLTIGPLRAWAVEQAIGLWELDERTDAFLVLDDDDYYSPDHARSTLRAMHDHPGCVVGARDTGILWQAGQQAPDLVVGGPYGPGPHATWGVPFRTYRAAGGYQADPVEDLALLSRVGWQGARNHADVTHVRYQYNTDSFSATKGDRAAGLPSEELVLVPHMTSAQEYLARWCSARMP